MTGCGWSRSATFACSSGSGTIRHSGTDPRMLAMRAPSAPLQPGQNHQSPKSNTYSRGV